MKYNFILIFCAVLFNTQLISCFNLIEFLENIFKPPTYKLTYFPIRARAEFIRFIFAAAGQQYEDYRLDPATWQQLKSTFPFGQLPTLEVRRGSEVVEIAQSQAIARFLAKKFGFGGSCDMDSAIIDMYAAQLGDLFNTIGTLQNNNQTQKLFDETWPTNLKFFETRLIKNGNGYLVGNRLSWADLYLSQMTEFLDSRKSSILVNFPNVKALDDRVRSMPRIAEWLEKRPKTEM